MPASDVDLEALARWEIPGEVAISGLARKGRLRRVWLHCRFPSLDHEALFPAGIWLSKKSQRSKGGADAKGVEKAKKEALERLLPIKVRTGKPPVKR